MRWSLRRWSVRRSRLLEDVYHVFERSLLALAPLLLRFDGRRLEAVTVTLEKPTKGLLFDCRMCGQCALSATGMSCPMNCPKSLRNGPCGGVRMDGRCEVKPDMVCVWVDAVEGAAPMREGETIQEVSPPVDHRLWQRSSWLRVLRQKSGG
ncbi:MAG: methylenetetrahydrofolate reductase C-terminal domain-containing protein [Geminicoccaceae bacterium]